MIINQKEGYISINYRCPEPRLAAEVIHKSQLLLQKYITDFKLEKLRINHEFIVRSYNSAKKNFDTKQEELALFRDKNKNLASEMARTQEEKLHSEYNLLLSVYTEIAKQKEQSQIALKESTPILTIIQPAIIPLEKSGPSRGLIIIGFVFLGFISSAFIAYFRDSFNNLKNKIFA